MFRLGADEIEASWGDFAHLLPRLKDFDVTGEELKRTAQASLRQIWGFENGEVRTVCITEIIQTPRGLICLILGAVSHGIPKPLMERLHDEIGKWAKDLGCVAVRIHGRKGWLRWDRRFKQTGIVAERPL